MLSLADNADIFLISGITDMRKGVDRLVARIAETCTEDVFKGGYFLFCNRHRTTIKIIYWDRNGFCMWYKRLDKDKFWWPMNIDEVSKYDACKIRWVLDGLDPNEINGHKKLDYQIIY